MIIMAVVEINDGDATIMLMIILKMMKGGIKEYDTVRNNNKRSNNKSSIMRIRITKQKKLRTTNSLLLVGCSMEFLPVCYSEQSSCLKKITQWIKLFGKNLKLLRGWGVRCNNYRTPMLWYTYWGRKSLPNWHWPGLMHKARGFNRGKHTDRNAYPSNRAI